MSNVYVLWRRLFAFIIDSIILMVIGAILCKVFYNPLLSIGDWAILVGFILFMLYYGIQNSVLCKGQTVGKRIFRIKIVAENGQYLTLIQSMLRSLVLTPMLIFNNVLLPIGYASIIGSMIVAGMSLIQVVLFLINRPSRQLLHDLLVKSVCINTNSEIQNVESNKVKLTLGIVIIIFTGFILSIPISKFVTKISGMSMRTANDIQKALKQKVNAKLVGLNVNYNKDLNSNKVTSEITYVITIPQTNLNDEKLCMDNIARTISVLSEHNVNLKEFDAIRGTIVQYLDIGIFRFNRSIWRSGSWEQWSEYIKSNNIK